MPPIEPGSLTPLLEALFERSAQEGAGVHTQLRSGLHLKVAQRGERRQVIVWRDGDRLPSGKECEIVGDDAGMIHPAFRSWQCKESPQAFLITDAFKGQLCTHAWGMTVHFDEDRVTGHTSTCTACGARWRTSTPKRGKKLSAFYNGKPIRAGVLERFLLRGPVPEGAEQAQEAQEPASPQPQAKAVTGQVCGTCRHGTPDLGDVACTLGWEAHEQYWCEREKTSITGAHPGVPLPLLAPQTKCMALGGRWLPRVAGTGMAGTGEVEAA